jgi:SAM-dependent methyltransferase
LKICFQCQARFDAQRAACPSCGAQPAQSDGFALHAPAMAHSGTGFKPEYFDELSQLEARNFWFRARNALIVDAIRRHWPDARNFLEVGCGTGYVLSGLAAAFPDMRLQGSELFVEGLPHAARRVPRAQLMQMDARDIPYEGEFDLVGAFDVIEHIEDHEAVARSIHRALAPGGGVVMTVPQHPSLWSSTDDYACHVRRYRRGELEAVLQAAGFRILSTTSFVTLLLPALALSRLMPGKQDADADPTAEFRIPGFVNASLYGVMQLERWLIRAGVRFPIGGTRLVCAEKVS